jgi:hypothetical protein
MVRKPEGKRPLGRPRCRWVDNIKMHVGEIGWDGMDWIDMAQNKGQWRALVSTILNLRVPYNFGEVLEWLHNWRLLEHGSVTAINESQDGEHRFRIIKLFHSIWIQFFQSYLISFSKPYCNTRCETYICIGHFSEIRKEAVYYFLGCDAV